MLATALAEFGDLGGIVFNVQTQQLVGGHQRTSVFNRFRPEVVITDRFDPATDVGTVALGYLETQEGERFAYREVSWPMHKEMAANIAANKSAGTFEIPHLQDMMHEMDALNLDLDLTMFDEMERGELMGGAPSEPQMQTQADGFRITITCTDGEQQAELMQRLTDEGISCRASYG